MLGTIGLTCAFPFEGDELYGQHVHLALTQTPATGPYVPAFFTPAEYATLSRLTDVIIPPTTTPGAVGAGVPEYIDRVVGAAGDDALREGLPGAGRGRARRDPAAAQRRGRSTAPRRAAAALPHRR